MIIQVPLTLHFKDKEPELIGMVQLDDSFLDKFPNLAIAPTLTLVENEKGEKYYRTVEFSLVPHGSYVEAVGKFMAQNNVKPIPEEYKN